MTRSFLSKLPAQAQEALLEDLNYLNLEEIKAFCKGHSIPYRIAILTPQGQTKATREDDRKGVILHRIRHYLATGEVLAQTCFPATVVCFDPLPKQLAANDRLYYGQYDKGSPQLLRLLQSLTAGRFRNGAVARILARQYWSRGEAPTYMEFASAWLQASAEHTRPNGEWAFLSDRSAGKDTTTWKRLREEKAAQVMRLLSQISTE